MENENKFTPKPWKVIVLDGETYINPDRGSDEYALIAKFIGTPEKKRNNAILAASAPDLLAACESAYELLYNQMDDAEELDHMTSGHDADTCVLCQLREAINKAKGE